MRSAILAAPFVAVPTAAMAMSLGLGLGLDTRASVGGGVIDSISTPAAAAYSFRKVRSAYAGSAVKLRRTTGGTLDVGFTAAGDFDTAAAATFCLATTCFLDTWYDQSTNARHAVQATAGSQPPYVANCIGDKPCTRGTSAVNLAVAGAVPIAAPLSFSVVANFGSGAGQCSWPAFGSNTFSNWAGTPNTWLLFDGTTYIAAAAADSAWHAGIGIMAGASSVLRLDGTEAAGTIASAGTSAGFYAFVGAAATTCSITEMVHWSGYALTASERSALANNQKDYWTPLPLDTFATPAAAYSMRRLKSSYSGPAVRLRRASDNAEADIGFLSFTGFTGAPIDVAAANAHCAATSCTVATIYDQSGNARHATRAFPDQPAYVANCNGALPCIQTTAGNQLLLGPSITPAAAGKGSFSAVANRRVGTGDCYWMLSNGINAFRAVGAANSWYLEGGGGSILAPASDAAWHAGVGVLNAASSVVGIDAIETTGSVAGNASAGNIYVMFGGAATTCALTEAVYWDGYYLTASERAALMTNQRNFWAIP